MTDTLSSMANSYLPTEESPESMEIFQTPATLQASPVEEPVRKISAEPETAPRAVGPVQERIDEITQQMVPDFRDILEVSEPSQSETPSSTRQAEQGLASLVRLGPRAKLEGSENSSLPRPLIESPSPKPDLLSGEDGESALLGAGPTMLTQYPESAEPRATAALASCQLEKQKKTTIFVLHEGQQTVVSWFQDTPKVDVQQAILCACECMLNSGIELLELHVIESEAHLAQLIAEGQHQLGGKLIQVKVPEGNADNIPANENRDPSVLRPGHKWFLRGRKLEFEDFADDIQDNQLYFLLPARERGELSQISGHKYRRLLVEVPPLQHIEAQKAIRCMRQGTNLLRTTTLEDRHFRFFQLSGDLKRLVWYSSNKAAEDTMVDLQNVSEIAVGNEVRDASLPDALRAISFLVRGNGFREHLSAKDENEFDMWVTGIKALAAHWRGMRINKLKLLSHSRRFKMILEENLTTIPEALPPMSSANFAKLVKFNISSRSEAVQKAKLLQHQLNDAHEKALEIDYSKLVKDKPSTPPVSSDPANAPEGFEAAALGLFDKQEDDLHMEYNKLKALIQSTRITLQEVDHLLATHRQNIEVDPTINQDELLKEIALKLWVANVDIENVQDIYSRLTAQEAPFSVKRTLNEIQKQLDFGKVQVSKTWSSWVTSATAIVSPAVAKLKTLTSDGKKEEQPKATVLEEPASSSSSAQSVTDGGHNLLGLSHPDLLES